ncbi:MAG: laccase domain-containing protein [Clostridiales bacterium]|nr:laccase domain-containing protein [Candidatus Crickella caballi]
MKIRLKDEKHVFNIHEEGIPFLSFDMLDRLGIPNLYSTRYISYDSMTGEGVKGLRLAIMTGEDPAEARPVIYDNMSVLAGQLGASLDRECITFQKHTTNVYTVTENDLGFDNLSSREIPIDGLVTNLPDVALVAYGGDCPPVYIVDPVRKAIGLVHAGWRGTLGRIPAVAIKKMEYEFGCRPEDMYAAVGIGICEDCYEMGDEIFELFAEQWIEEDARQLMKRYPATGADGEAVEKYHLNLIEANRLTLVRAGIPEDHIALSNVCTCCNSDVFYSYRARRLENEQQAMLVNRFK